MSLTINQEKKIRKARLDGLNVDAYAWLDTLARKVADYRRAQKMPPATKGLHDLRVTLLAEIDVLLAKLGVE